MPVKKIKEFEESFLTTLEQKFPEVLSTFKSGKLTDEAKSAVEKLAAEMSAQY